MSQDRNIIMRQAGPEDSRDIRDLHARAFGPGRFARAAYRVREGTPEFSPFCRVCRIDGRLAAAVRFTPVRIGGKGGALLLGPLAVEPDFANQGYGRGLVGKALEDARAAGIAIVVLTTPASASSACRRARSCCRGPPTPSAFSPWSWQRGRSPAIPALSVRIVMRSATSLPSRYVPPAFFEASIHFSICTDVPAT